MHVFSPIDAFSACRRDRADFCLFFWFFYLILKLFDKKKTIELWCKITSAKQTAAAKKNSNQKANVYVVTLLRGTFAAKMRARSDLWWLTITT